MNNDIIDLVPEQEMEEMKEMKEELERRREMFPVGPRQVAEVTDLDEDDEEGDAVTERYSYAEPAQVVEQVIPPARQRRNRKYDLSVGSPVKRTIMTRRLAAAIVNNQ